MRINEKKYTNEILDDVECYRSVLDGRLKRFPAGFWTKPWSQQSSAVITRYLLQEKLKYTEEDIKSKVTGRTFGENKLRSLLLSFNGVTSAVLENAYPGRFKPWELKCTPSGFWKEKDNIKEAVRWLVKTKLDNNRERVCREFTSNFLYRNGLYSLVRHGVFNLIDIAYPNKFKPWEFNQVTNNYWSNPDNLGNAVRWLVETKLDNNRERVCKELNNEFITKHGLQCISRYGIYYSVNTAYPGEFKPWELYQVSPGFWDNTDNIKDAVRWLVETKLDNSRERVCKEFTYAFLTKYNLVSIACTGLYNLVNLVYPGEYKPWDFAVSPRGWWSIESNIREAVRWVVETELDNDMERVKKEFNVEFLKKNGMSHAVTLGVYNVINIAYPNEFSRSDFVSCSGVCKSV